MKAGWKQQKLGEISDLITRGISPKYTNAADGLCVLNQKCVRNHEVNFSLARGHDETAKKVSTERFIQQGDVLVNSTGTGTLGRVAQVRERPMRATVDSHITIVRPKPGLFFNDFFGYAMVAIEDEIAQKGEGCGGQTELSRETLRNDFLISYPENIEEQRRIVGILNEAFAAIDRAKEVAEGNLRNAREVFEGYLEGLFTDGGEGWEHLDLGTLLQDLITGPFGSALHRSDYVEEGTPVVNPQNIINGRIVPLESTLISEKHLQALSRFALRENDIVMARRGEMGRCAVVSAQESGWLCGTGSLILRLKNQVSAQYVSAFLSSAATKKVLENASVGTTMSNLNQGILVKLKIAIPNFGEQQLIVGRFERLLAQIEQLQAVYIRKLAALEELRSAILRRAFAGELV